MQSNRNFIINLKEGYTAIIEQAENGMYLAEIRNVVDVLMCACTRKTMAEIQQYIYDFESDLHPYKLAINEAE